MLSVIIVDDDKLIREGIKNLIDWQKNGFELVGEAGNGHEAVEFIRSRHVDIIISDIYMPIMDGIELIKRVRASDAEAKFLVISNYDDFTYVKEAMRLGASDYVLKYEIEEDNLIKLLAGIRQELENEKRRKSALDSARALHENARIYMTEQFWGKVLDGKLSREETDEQAAKLEIYIHEGIYPILIVDMYRRDTDLASPEADKNAGAANEFAVEVRRILEDYRVKAVVPFAENRWIILLNHTEKSITYVKTSIYAAANRLIKYINTLGGTDAVITTGSIDSNVYELSGSLAKARLSAESKFYSGAGSIIDSSVFKGFADEIDDDFIQTCQKKILHSVAKVQKEDTFEYMDELFRHINERIYRPELAYAVFTELQIGLSRLLKEKGIINAKEVFQDFFQRNKLFEQLGFLKNIENYFKQILEDIFNLMDGTAPQPKRPEIIKALEYINKSYMNDVTLNNAAEHIGLSRNYFCKLFKEEMGENFIDYLKHFRIEKAKFIMEHEKVKIVEVAYRVGIKDYRYFCKQFKQYTGKRPKEYRVLA